MATYIPTTPDELQEMLGVIGVKTIDDLFAEIPRAQAPGQAQSACRHERIRNDPQGHPACRNQRHCR